MIIWHNSAKVKCWDIELSTPQFTLLIALQQKAGLGKGKELRRGHVLVYYTISQEDSDHAIVISAS